MFLVIKFLVDVCYVGRILQNKREEKKMLED